MQTPQRKVLQQWRRTTWLLVGTAALLLLAGCGYSLRGSAPLSVDLSRLVVQYPNAADPLATDLVSALKAAGVEIIDSRSAGANDDVLVLSIASKQLERRPVSVNARARAAQYELTLVSVISLSVGNTLLLDAEDISESSEYFEEIENLAGTQDETLLLTQEMRSRLVQQIIRRVSAALP